MKFKYHRWFQWLCCAVGSAGVPYFLWLPRDRTRKHPGGRLRCLSEPYPAVRPPFAAVALRHRTPLRLMAKKSCSRKKLFAWLIAALGAFPVDREGADITAIKTALSSVVRAGQKLIIFPQGTRHAAEGETKKGAAMLAVKTRAPILPMYITEGKGFPLPEPRSSSASRSRRTRKQKDYGLHSRMTSSAASTR